MRSLAFAAAMTAVFAATDTEARPKPFPAPNAAGCATTVPFLRVGIRDGIVPPRWIYGLAGERPILFLSGLKIDADGAPRAYHPDDVSGLDWLANAREGGRWVGVVTDRWGRPFIQRASDPAPGFYVSKTALEDPLVPDPADPRRFVDAERVPYIALPGGAKARAAYRGIDLYLGDLAIVYNIRTRRTTAAVFADLGPAHALGEGSIELARRLGYDDTSPRHGGTGARENVFVVFPGSGAGFPRDPQHMERTARAFLAGWGGERRLADCAPALK